MPLILPALSAHAEPITGEILLRIPDLKPIVAGQTALPIPGRPQHKNASQDKARVGLSEQDFARMWREGGCPGSSIKVLFEGHHGQERRLTSHLRVQVRHTGAKLGWRTSIGCRSGQTEPSTHQTSAARDTGSTSGRSFGISHQETSLYRILRFTRVIEPQGVETQHQQARGRFHLSPITHPWNHLDQGLIEVPLTISRGPDDAMLVPHKPDHRKEQGSSFFALQVCGNQPDRRCTAAIRLQGSTQVSTWEGTCDGCYLSHRPRCTGTSSVYHLAALTGDMRNGRGFAQFSDWMTYARASTARALPRIGRYDCIDDSPTRVAQTMPRQAAARAMLPNGWPGSLVTPSAAVR